MKVSRESRSGLQASILFQICPYSEEPVVRLLQRHMPNAHHAIFEKASSLLPPLLTSAKLRLPFCFTA